MNEDKSIKMSFLYPTQGIFNCIIILEKNKSVSTELKDYHFKSYKNTNQTYQHIFSSFISCRITVEMFSKSWLYMCTFILKCQKNKTKKHKTNKTKKPETNIREQNKTGRRHLQNMYQTKDLYPEYIK